MADLRPQYTDEAVGANHPTKADVINRAYNVEHEEDGTHVSFQENITQADGKSIATDKIKARDGDGLLLEDDGGNGIEITDDGTIHMAKQSGVSCYLSGNQDVASGAGLTIVEFDTEEFDIQNEHNTGTYTTTIKKDGRYLVSAVIFITEDVGDGKYCNPWIYKNGAGWTNVKCTNGALESVGLTITAVMDLSGTDTIDIRVRHNAGVNREIAASQCRYSCVKIA